MATVTVYIIPDPSGCNTLAIYSPCIALLAGAKADNA